MALLFIDGFDQYGTTNGNDADGIEHLWPTNLQLAQINVADGRISGKSIVFATSNAYVQTPPLAQMSTVVVGFAFKYAAHANASADVVCTLMEGASAGVNLRLRQDGEWEVYNNTTLLGSATSGFSLPTGTWAFIELKVTTHDSAGAVELRIDGVTALNLTSEDTQPATGNIWVTALRLNGHSVPADAYTFDDCYVLDTTGSVNNDFLGDHNVTTLFPANEGDTIEWTPSTGTDNSDLVDDNPHNTDTDYVTGASGNLDLYDLDTLSGAGSIAGIQMVSVCRETDVNPFSIKHVVKASGTEYADSAAPIGSSLYLARKRLMEENPDTTNPWSQSEINAAQFGMELT
jgi:hypothetical protein